jgi:hypothetical protein
MAGCARILGTLGRGVLLAALAGCSADAAVVQRCAGPTMGSSYEIKFLGSVPLAAVQAVVDDELAAAERTFSRWRPDSEIQRLNAHASTEPFAVSARFAGYEQHDSQELLRCLLDALHDDTNRVRSKLAYEELKDPPDAPDAAVSEAWWPSRFWKSTASPSANGNRRPNSTS